MVERHWKGPDCLTVLNKDVKVNASSYQHTSSFKRSFLLLLVIMIGELIKLREKVELKTFVSCTIQTIHL